jgi:hypothetical protein
MLRLCRPPNFADRRTAPLKVLSIHHDRASIQTKGVNQSNVPIYGVPDAAHESVRVLTILNSVFAISVRSNDIEARRMYSFAS